MNQAPQTGAEIIKAALAQMPAKPGIYRMKNAAGDILYIGKAKHLPNRVGSYANPHNASGRILRMVAQVASVEITVTSSEAEALLLEATLIKQHQPRYNVLLKDDKSFPYILFTTDHDFARIKKHRGAQKEAGQYFGPFASAGAVNQAIIVLQKAFLLRPCSDAIFKSRTRPCLQYQIKRCTAPCVGYVDKNAYAKQVQMAADFLRGKSQHIQEEMAAQMYAASQATEYEKAAALRDRIRALTRLQSDHKLTAPGLVDADVIAVARKGGLSVIQVYLYRAGQHFGHQTYYPRHDIDTQTPEILSGFIGQFYQNHTPPAEIYLNEAPEDATTLSEALCLRAGRKCTLIVPQRGDKRMLIERVSASAQEALTLALSTRAQIHEHHANIAKLFALPAPPSRIEVYDNSHIMGTHAVGAMIVATPEGFEKSSYRRFNMKDAGVAAGDDYGMMRYMLMRRLKRHNGSDGSVPPDLLLIDGGAGQLGVVRDVLTELKLTIPVVGIAKGRDRNAGREWFYMPDSQPFQLPENDATLHYIQRLRDEAHRFAISSHRAKRSRALTSSALDDISGIGAGRKRALLSHFGSRDAVMQASVRDLQEVKGISEKIAQTIYDYFHS